jgi:hypothetical protein
MITYEKVIHIDKNGLYDLLKLAFPSFPSSPDTMKVECDDDGSGKFPFGITVTIKIKEGFNPTPPYFERDWLIEKKDK